MPENEKREEFVVKIGKKLMKALEEQKKKIKEVAYNCINPSNFEAGEILATKIFTLDLINKGVDVKDMK